MSDLVDDLNHMTDNPHLRSSLLEERIVAEAATEIERLRAALAEREKRLKTITEAMTPSLKTKKALMGEFSFLVLSTDHCGEYVRVPTTVPWTTIKEIMAAIRALAKEGGG